MAVDVLTPRSRERVERLDRIWHEQPGLLGWLTTVNHKRIALLYFFTTLVFFGLGGVEALVIRTQLARPNEKVVSPHTFNQLFTLHGVTMIFLFIIPMTTGAFGNYLVPLMIGARDMAFPRLNAFSYWLFLGSGLFIYTSLFIGQAPDAGWFDYVPLALRTYSPGHNIDFYALGLIFNGVSTTVAAINFIVTIFKLRAPGMSLNRTPLFAYAMLAVSFALVFALPPLTTDLVLLELQRNLGFHFFDVGAGGDPLLWQHLFWLFGHPEVYIIVLPAFGIATSIIPTFAKRRMIAFPLVALAELLVAFIGFGVWAHHMFATGLPTASLVFFAAASMMVVVPSTIQIYAWLFTVNTGRPEFRAPLLFIGGFILFFVLGGLSGIMFAAIPFDQAATDTYFVVAHFHFIIFGAAVFPLLGGMYYWFPKVTGRMYHEGWAKTSFWLAFTGTALTFFPMHIVGLLGMTRRVYTYEPHLGWDTYNLLETIGAFVLTAGLLVIFANLAVSRFRGAPAGADPFYGGTLEWATASPPPEYNFPVVPTVTSPYPNWDREDRLEDGFRLDRGDLVLEEGHETPASTVVDGRLAEVLDMPSESIWPIVIALCFALIFAMLLVHHFVIAGIFGALALLGGAAWHTTEAFHPSPERSDGTSQLRGKSEGLFAGRSPGWWGIALFVATEATLFGTLIGSYFHLRFRNVHWPPAGVPEPKLTIPLVLAGVLLATILPMIVASSAATAGRTRLAWAAVFAALIVQAGYFAMQVHLYVDDLAKFSPQGSSYGSIYFTLVGAHAAHVAAGLLLSAWLLLRLGGGLTRYRTIGVQSVALYWYFVAVLTVAVVLTQVSPSLV